MRLALRYLCCLAFATICGSRVSAHEVRPAYLEIVQTRPEAYEVTWKQPATGELVLHLVPHLSNGWLDRRPDQQYAAAGFLIRTWRIRSSAPDALTGRWIEIEGLESTLTDVFVRVQLSDRDSRSTIIRPDIPRALISAEPQQPLALTTYLRLGIEHILTGPDHLSFVLGLMLLVRHRTMLLKTITAFTVAHCMTLTAVILGKLSPPPSFVEALISLSILLLAHEIVRVRAGHDSCSSRHPWAVAFVFGLFHGMGFATGLKSLGYPSADLFTALTLFNLGVEIGQLVFIVAIFSIRRALHSVPVLLRAPATHLPVYVVGISGAYWTVQSIASWWGATTG